VIPAWDDYARDFLGEAIESVRAQTVPVELVVVDNASAAPIADVDGGRVVRLRRRVSVGAARNAGLAEVATPYVVFLDADDLLLGGAVEAMLRQARARPGAAAWVLGIVDGVTGRRHRSPRPVAGLLARRPGLFALANASWSLLPTQGATLLLTDLVRALGGYDDASHGEDWPLCAAMAFHGRMAFDDVPALIYRWRPNSPGGPGTSSAQVRDNARRVRERLRAEPAAPSWLPVVLPIVQLVVVEVVRPLVRSARGLPVRLRRRGSQELGRGAS
jgi:glycosyltransferase involved in cell wall biosynthesis